MHRCFQVDIIVTSTTADFNIDGELRYFNYRCSSLDQGSTNRDKLSQTWGKNENFSDNEGSA